jgi:hypothetical protein
MVLLFRTMASALLLLAGIAIVAPSSPPQSSDEPNHRRTQQGPPPIAPEIFILLAGIPKLDKVLHEFETPITSRFAAYYTIVFWNCAAVYSTDYKDAITKTFPTVSVLDSNLHTTANRAACAAQSGVSYSLLSVPDAAAGWAEAVTGAGATVESTIHPSVFACTTVECLQEIAITADYGPITMGHIVAKQAYDYSITDGWNQLGTDGGCQYNCRPFADVTGYAPVQIASVRRQIKAPKSVKVRSGRMKYMKHMKHMKSKKPSPTPKGSSVGTSSSDRWQPLLEDDGMGFFHFQQHVVPQIGLTSKFFALDESARETTTVQPPEYSASRYGEAQLVLERMLSLDDDQTKMEIEVFDDKLLVGNTLVGSFINKVLMDGYQDTALGAPGLILSYERLVNFLVGLLMAEIDSIVIAWKEKVATDLVRPTTIIKSWGDEMITTWVPHEGIQTLPARDFEAYIRVMPHSEYTSGSSCIFTALQNYVLTYIDSIGLEQTFPVVFPEIPAGASKVEPGQTPTAPLILSYPTIQDMAYAGGQSRLNGGMHFADSVPAGEELCVNVGAPVATTVLGLVVA